MSEAAKSSFVYVTYIRTTPEALWAALTSPEFMRQYWFGMNIETDWKTGSPWRLIFPDGRIADAGEIVEFDKPNRLVLTWRNEFRPELREEGYSRMTYEIEQQGDMVKFTVLHEMERPDSKLIEGVSNGWPMVLAGLKSLLETGESLDAGRRWPKEM